ncbi:hypothetical protein DL98DRAFT_512629, partial [Cadophora sp. DSE1049]
MKHKRSASEGWRSQIRSRLTQSGPKLTLTTQAGSNVETITLPRGLRLFGRNPTVNRKPLSKTDISEPILLSSSAYEGILTQTASKAQPLELVDPSLVDHIPSKTNSQPEVPQIRITSDTSIVERGDTSDTQNNDSSFESIRSGTSSSAKAPSRIPRLKTNIGETRTLQDPATTDFQLGDLDFEKDFDDRRNRFNTGRQSSPGSFYRNPFSSAMPMDDEVNDDSDDDVPNYKVLYIAASLFGFNIGRERKEAGYSYLTYQAGDIFDVIAEKGELWLAKRQDDPSNRIGWIWSKHFARLARDDTVLPVSSLPRQTRSRNTSASSDSGFDFGFK